MKTDSAHGKGGKLGSWLARAVAAICALGASAAPAVAIDATWNVGAVGNWSDGANWDTNPDYPNHAGYEVTMVDGEATIDGDFSIGRLDWVDGNLVGEGVLTVDFDATISGPEEKGFSGATINLKGNTVWTEGTIGSVEPEGGVVNNSGSFDVQFDAFWAWLATQTPVFNNLEDGTFVKSAGESTALIWVELNNDGLVHVQSGGLHLAGGGLHAGQFDVDGETALTFSDFNEGFAEAGALTTTLDVTSVINSAGTVRFGDTGANSRIDVYGAVDTDYLEVWGLDATFVLFHQGSTYGEQFRGTFEASESAVAFDGMTANIFEMTIHDDATVSVVNDGTVLLDSTVTISETGKLHLGDGFTGSDGALVFDGLGEHRIGGVGETILSGSGGSKIESPTGSLIIEPTAVIRGHGVVEGGVNSGTIRVEGEGTTLSLRRLSNDGGHIRATAGNTIQIAVPSIDETTFVQTGGALIAEADGAIESIRGIDMRGGVLGGSGDVRLTSDLAEHNFVRATTGGVIAPGNSIGSLTVDGDVVIGDGGRLAIQLDGAESTLLQIVKGQFQVAAGDLDLSSANDLLDVTTLGPLTAAQFLIATYAGTLLGTFDHVTPGYSVTYDTVQKMVFVHVGGVGPSADFDMDGDVDGVDFLAWQQGSGVASGATKQQGDANNDGAVDAADLVVWQGQYAPAAVAAGAVVPEPGGAWLAIVAAVVAATRRRRRC